MLLALLLLLAPASSARAANGDLAPQLAGTPTAVHDILERVPAENLGGVATEYLDHIGRSITRAKWVDADGSVAGACYADTGEVLADCGVALRARNAQGYYADFGSITRDLWSVMATARPYDRIPVFLWLANDETYPRKEDLLDDPAYAAAWQNVRQTMHLQAKERARQAWETATSAELHYVRNAPAAFGRLMPHEIMALAKKQGIGAIYHSPKPLPQGYISSIAADNLSTTGNGVNLCVIAPDAPFHHAGPLTIADSYCEDPSYAWYHSAAVHNVVRSNMAPSSPGVAADADVYWAHYAACGDEDSSAAIDWCIDEYADVWVLPGDILNWSATCTATENLLLDYWTKANPYPLIAVASGNNDAIDMQDCDTPCTGTPGVSSCLGYNVLVVGGSNTCGTDPRGDDKIFCPAKSDDNYFRELPLLVAPAQDIVTDEEPGNSWNGTSFAAPMVAAAATHLIETNNQMMNPWPEVVRSILMATADENVDGTDTFACDDTIDDRDGAGELNVAAAVALANASNKRTGSSQASEQGFDYGTITSAQTAEGAYYGQVYKVRTSSSGKKVRIVLSWDASVQCSDPAAGSCSGVTVDADLDLYLRLAGTSPNYVKRSFSGANSYEFIEFPISADTTYEIGIKVFDWNSNQTYFGVAWVVDDFPLD
jgi:hypothetical protein